jgi:hypothetical protein
MSPTIKRAALSGTAFISHLYRFRPISTVLDKYEELGVRSSIRR